MALETPQQSCKQRYFLHNAVKENSRASSLSYSALSIIIFMKQLIVSPSHPLVEDGL